MSLHFLLKAEARTRSLVEVLGMSDDDAFTLFRRVRWGDGDEVICPHCGLVHRHYFRPARQIWRCVGCQEDFSVTSGTIFAFHKLPLRLYLAAVILFANAVKGISALQMGGGPGRVPQDRLRPPAQDTGVSGGENPWVFGGERRRSAWL